MTVVYVKLAQNGLFRVVSGQDRAESWQIATQQGSIM
jgi:hypothetical protein